MTIKKITVKKTRPKPYTFWGVQKPDRQGLSMLYVELKNGEFFSIGDDIRVHCGRTGAWDSLTLGIEAPRDVKVLRGSYVEQNLKALADEGDPAAKEALLRLNREREAIQKARRKRPDKRKAS
jgi:sRNA-binding carbon storage regulator CsrA